MIKESVRRARSPKRAKVLGVLFIALCASTIPGRILAIDTDPERIPPDEEQRSECERITHGRFSYPVGSEVRSIVRDGSVQTEYWPSTGETLHMRLQWVYSCRYVIHVERVEEGNANSFPIGAWFDVTVVRIEGPRIYFIARSWVGQSYDGVLIQEDL